MPAIMMDEEIREERDAEKRFFEALGASSDDLAIAALDTYAGGLEALDAERWPPAWNERNVHLAYDVEHRFWSGSMAPYRAMLEASTDRRGDARLRVLGACWGMSQLCHPDHEGNVLVTATAEVGDATRVEWAGEGKVVRCRLGATFDDVHRLLGDRYSLANQPGFSNLSVAGCIGTGGHGSGLSCGPLSSLVQAVELLAPAGDDHIRIERGSEDFEAAVCHLGRLGPVLAMDLEVVPAYAIAEVRPLYRLGRGGEGRWRDELRALVAEAVAFQRRGDAHSAALWLAPYFTKNEPGVLYVAFGQRSITSEPAKGKRPLVQRSHLLQAAGQSLAASLAENRLLRSWNARVLQLAVQGTENDQRVVMPSREGLDFGAPNRLDVAALEMAMPLERGADALVATIERLNALAAEDRHLYCPIGVRFTGNGPEAESCLSPFAGRAETLHIELPTFEDDDVFLGHRVLPDVQRMLAERFEGRPHWGQRIYLGAKQLARAWPAAARSRMRLLVERVDPESVFASPLIDRVLAS